MSKKMASEETVMAFLRAVYPGRAELAVAMFDEETVLAEATRLILAGRWIKVADRLPDEGQRVIYYFEPVGMHFGRYKHTEEGEVFYSHLGFLTDDVTHWMPRPEIPEL